MTNSIGGVVVRCTGDRSMARSKKSNSALFTNKEKAALDASVVLCKAFKALGNYHPSDMGDFVYHIHAIQSLIIKRPTIRAYPKYLTQLEKPGD